MKIVWKKREMGVTHAELLRLLPAAVGHAEYCMENNRISLMAEEGRVVIHYSPQKLRSLGALRLPVTHLAFSFQGFSEPSVKHFMARFDRAFQRAGG